MRRKILGVFICMLFVIIQGLSLSATATTNQSYPEMTFRGGFGITLVIKNNDNETLTNVIWMTVITGGIMDLINKTSGDHFPKLEPGQQKIRKIFLFGFGMINIHVRITVDGLQGKAYDIEGFVIGPFVIIRQNS